MLVEVVGIFLACPFSFGQHFGEEAIYTINGKKALHSVSEKFLSVSIDPAVLLTGLNLSDASYQLAKHLSPAYIRVAGPSTQFVKYDDMAGENTGNVIVSPTMWFGINEWLTSANLTPVFGINDGETTKGEWNPHSTMPLLDVSDKFNLSCYWQLGYDCSNKTQEQYIKDLKIFKHILEAFPEKKDTWKIVGSDLSRCVGSDYVEDTRKILEQLEDVIAAVVWDPTTKSEASFLEEHLPYRLLSMPIKPKVPIWTTSPKTSHPASFISAISWARQIGQAAEIGYEVIFRQPRFHEILHESPPFWISFFHKALMGRTVLDVKAAIPHDEISVYAHCTSHQNNFIRSGAMTIFMINNSTKNHTIFMRFGTVLLKNIEVQSYVLTAVSEDATDVYLNGDKLSLDQIAGDKMNILPKLRRAKIMNYLSLSLPPKSIGFFVLPGAQLPVCISQESDVSLIMKEIAEDQKIPFSREVSVEVVSRFASNRRPTLRELQNLMEKEFESDEKYYEKMKSKKNHVQAKKVSYEGITPRRTFSSAKPKQQVDTVKESPKRIFELELTSAELRRVLEDRAKVKASKKNIIFTSEELEEIMDKATERFLNDKNTSIRIRKKAKRDTIRDKKDINMRLLKLKTLGEKRRLMLKQLGHRSKHPPEQRQKRDINMDLLKLKTELLQNKHKTPAKSKFVNNEEKKATIRDVDQTSSELTEDFVQEEKPESTVPDGDVFAEMADPDDFFTTTTQKSKILITKTRPSLLIHKKIAFNVPRIKPLAYNPKLKLVSDEVENFDSFVNSNADAEDDITNENFACIHEYSGVGKTESKKSGAELWEAAAGSMEKKKDNRLPTITNRGLQFEELTDKDKFDSETFEEDAVNTSADSDYRDLESDEKNPVRFKRNADEELKNRLFHKKKLDFLKTTQEKRKITFFNEKDDSFNKRYKSLTENLKTWRPSDILNLKSNKIKTSKRSVSNYVNSVENELDGFMNEIIKESMKIEPKLDRENGDYQLVFPNRDKIEMMENQDDTELKLVIHENENKCPVTEATTQNAKKSTNIQKISKKTDNSVWEKVFRKVTKFFYSLSMKLKNYVLDDLLKE